MPEPRFLTGKDAFGQWRERVHTGKAEPLYRAGEGALSGFPIGPRRVTLLGGGPGQGKTALSMQLLIDALRLDESLRLLVCNVEMGPDALLDRQLARLSGVDLTTIRNRAFTPRHASAIGSGMATLETVVERVCFVSAPFDLDNVAATADTFGADILALDYIQRIRPPRATEDKRGSVDATMSHLRDFAAAGSAVVVIAAVARTKDKKGRSSYESDGLGLASFRESSELEYGADDAFLLVPHKTDGGRVVLRHLKARHGEPVDAELDFDRSLQRFTSETSVDTARAREAVAQAWEAAEAAGDEGDPE